MPTGPDRPERTRGRIRALTMLRLVFSAASLGLIVLGLFTLREASRTRGWAKVDGRVVSSSVNSFTGRNGTTWRPMVIYSYSVGAVRFMSSRISFRPTVSDTRDGAVRQAARYPAGRAVTVFHDPQNPEQAVLEPARNPWLPIIAGGLFSMLAVGMRMLQARVEKAAH